MNETLSCNFYPTNFEQNIGKNRTTQLSTTRSQLDVDISFYFKRIEKSTAYECIFQFLESRYNIYIF